ncbi:hypothetical protein N7495_009240 [Penicillium taxi]|uniref:uncharacterized protein n=1 Tax=Penicillium taxi TaxID=168475 RepID=UPI002544DAA6|nr:uncharacterized protein N7495_009240 [Penicillium taxi]KAJ5884730.1 hypothetical protein N7495_009240 [Penicillium taxi]
MENLEIPSSQPQPAETNQHRTLNLDYTWRKFKTLISDEKNPDKPLYIIDYKIIPKPKFTFRSVGNITDDINIDSKDVKIDAIEAASEIIGKSSLHTFKIDADYECNGHKDTLIAQKRFKTSYTHRSAVLTKKGKPAVLSWTGECGITTWEFVCVDEDQSPLGKFTVNMWGLKKVGKIELMGPLADSQALVDEIVVTGVTLGYLMIWRANNCLSLVGALFNSPGRDNKFISNNVKDGRTAEEPALHAHI